MKKILILLPALILLVGCNSDNQPKGAKSDVPVKNVIYLIGDGMGLPHVNAAILESDEPLAMQRAQYTGFQITTCTTNKVTDSAAAGTALATGTKTYYGAIGVGPDTARLTSVLEKAAAKGLATGIVATYRVTDATPAAFIAHVKHRGEEEAIAEAYLETPIDLFIGGGRARFEQREDGRNLSAELADKGYQVVYTMEELAPIKSGKIAGLMHDGHLPRVINGRDPEYLLQASLKAFDILSQNDKGFFVMIEGSQIDGGGHANDIEQILTETYDFDKVVKAAFDFADANPGTLVVVTADHETGGLTLPAQGAGVRYAFSTGGHTGVMVPIFSYGAGAENFTGILDNTDIPNRINELLGI